MHCPNCGLSLSDASAQVCPRCGHQLPMPTQMSEYGYAAPPQGGSTRHDFTSPPAYSSSASGYSAQPPVQPGTPPNEPFYGQAAPSNYPPSSYPMYGPPGMPPANPPGYPPYGQYGPYGQGAPATTPFYGQEAPPSYPLYGSPMPGGYPQPAWPGMQPQPQQKRGNGLVIGLSIGLVVLILVGSIAAAAFIRNARTSTATSPTNQTATSLTPTSSKTIIFQDPLTSNTYGWLSDDHCSFASDGYHIKSGWICYAPAGLLSNFDVTVHVKQISGPLTYGYGIVFRRTSTGNEYMFDIDGNSKWVLFKCVSSSCSKLANWTSNASLQGGLNVSHTLEVQANGTHIACYADGTQLGSVDDSTYLSGKVGLQASNNIEAVFSNITITAV